MNKILTRTIGTGLNLLSYIAPEKTGALGFSLFCYPARPPLKVRHRKFLEAARYTTYGIGGELIQVYKWGHGPKRILFAHGWQSHAYRWKPYIEQLPTDQYTVYAVDAPGHGLSSGRALTVPMYAKALRKIMKEAGRIDAMVGHSLGSFTLLYLLHEYPDAGVKKLVLLAPPESVGEFFAFYKEYLRLSDRTVSLTKDHFREKLNREPEYFSAKRFAAGLDVKGLIIHDETDRDTSVENGRAIHQVWPASRLTITQGYGHNLRHQEVVNEVVQFIA